MKNDSSIARTLAYTHSYNALSGAVRAGVDLSTLRKTATAVLVASVLTGCTALSNPEKIKLDSPANTSEFKNRLYAGVAMGSSNLSPNTRGEGFSVDSSGDTGTQLRLGYDVHNLLSMEVDTSVLGRSTLRGNPGTAAEGIPGEVKYSAATISALVYGWSGVQSRSRREGLSAYGRFGFSALSKSSNVPDIEESGAVPILGIGAEYGFVNGLGLRAEITRFDSDVNYVGFGAVYRFGLSPQGIGRMIAAAAEPALTSKSTKVAKVGTLPSSGTIVERYAGPNARPANGGAPHLHYTSGAEPDQKYVGSMSERWRPAMRADDRDVDGVLDNVDSCPDTADHVTVDRFGCGLFDAVLHEVTFKSGSRWLTPRARAQLDLLADTLLAFPEARIQVRAHTDSRGAADMNLDLSSRRAEVVVLYLQSKGVHELQLQAVGIGETQPLDANNTSAGRKRNRRVDIVTLPDQDAGQLLVAENVSSQAVMTTQNTFAGKQDSAGTRIGNDEWNSAVKSTKPETSKGKASTRINSEPGLLAALPETATLSAQVRAATAKGPVYVPAPLPRPGYAPDFPFSGVLKGVNFERGESSLSPDAQNALSPLMQALIGNPSIKVAIMAHTDNNGGTTVNQILSVKRADSVVQHLIGGGVAPARLKAEGYGETLPLVQNVTDADRRRNRRVEVRVLK